MYSILLPAYISTFCILLEVHEELAKASGCLVYSFALRRVLLKNCSAVGAPSSISRRPMPWRYARKTSVQQYNTDYAWELE